MGSWQFLGNVFVVNFQNHISVYGYLIKNTQVKSVRFLNEGLGKLVLSEEGVWWVQPFRRCRLFYFVKYRNDT